MLFTGVLILNNYSQGTRNDTSSDENASSTQSESVNSSSKVLLKASLDYNDDNNLYPNDDINNNLMKLPHRKWHGNSSNQFLLVEDKDIKNDLYDVYNHIKDYFKDENNNTISFGG